jgi:hypothetical protein
MTMTKTTSRNKSAKVIGTAPAVVMTARGTIAHGADPVSALARIEQGLSELRATLTAQVARGTREIPRIATAPAPEQAKSPLYDHVRELITDRPMAFRELVAALPKGTLENSIKSVLVRLQRDGHPIVNLGNGARAIWFCDVHDRISQIANGRRVMSRRR